MAAMFQGIDGGEHRQVDDLVHFGPALQDVYRLRHPHEDKR
jgi:hypothetical protein